MPKQHQYWMDTILKDLFNEFLTEYHGHDFSRYDAFASWVIKQYPSIATALIFNYIEELFSNET